MAASNTTAGPPATAQVVRMLKSYLAIALRNLRKTRAYSIINIAGLAIGVASCVLIALFVQHELSFDRYHSQADRIYRFSRDFLPQDNQPGLSIAAMAPGFTPRFRQDFPQVREVARIGRCGGAGGGALISSEQEAYYEPGFASADNALFRIFDFDWKQGDPGTALLDPFDVVVTESLARKYFGRTDVMDEILTVENNNNIRVVGVIGDLPDNTHLNFAMLLSMEYATANLGPDFLNTWGSNCFHTYAVLEEGVDVDEIQGQSGEFFERHLGEGASRQTAFTATPVTDIHLRSHRTDELSASGSVAAVYAFSAIAVVILALACINFVNLSIARGAQRAREVGVRKAVGSGQGQLVTQFLGESTLLAVIAVVVALGLVALALPAFGAFVQKSLSLGFDPALVVLLLALTGAVGFVAGSYPAFYLSAFQPGRVLRGDVSRGQAAATLRKGLVLLQFAIAIALIVATVLVYQQTRYAQNIELGFDKDQIVVLTGSPTRGMGPQWNVLKETWLSHPGVLEVTASNIVPGTSTDNLISVAVAGGPPEPVTMSVLLVDFDFFETYGIGLVAGRTFSEAFGADRVQVSESGQLTGSASFVLSELGVRHLGLTTEEAVGTQIVAFGPGTIVGVVDDVYLESIHNAIEPVLYVIPPPQQGQFAQIREASLRVSGDDLAGTLAHIDAGWTQFNPVQPLTRRFLSQDFQALYTAEQRQSRVLLGFTILSIFIACLGLFGLASFATEQRTKEIGVRKVMGGTIWDIVKLFTTDFARLVLLANVIAWPAAWFLMRRWLDGFAYRIDIGIIPFVAAALLALLVAALTVGFVAARSASVKPMYSLRYE
jgi:putative ABC transport system permease protein